MNGQNNATGLWKEYGFLALWLILGLGLRVYNLGSHNLWYDEFVSFLDARSVALTRLYHYSPSHLYIVLLHFWTVCFGTSEFALRALSMLFGVLLIPLSYKLGRLLFNKGTGLASAFIVSISPIHIWYSQEARGYSLAVFLSMSAVYFLFLVIRKNTLRLWISFTLLSVLAIYTNYFCSYIIIFATVLFLLKENRHLLRKWIASLSLIAIPCLPLVPIFVRRFNFESNNSWIPIPHLNSIVITLENFNAGYNATPGVYFLTSIAFSLLFITGILHWRSKRNYLVYLSLFLVAPIGITYLISQKVPFYLDRSLALFSPLYYLTVAAGLASVRITVIKALIYASMLLLASFCLYNYFSYRMPAPIYHHVGVHVKKPVKPAADFISQKLMEGDALGYSGVSGTSVFYYMLEKITSEKIGVFSFIVKPRLDPYWWRRETLRFGGDLITKDLIRLDAERSYRRLFEMYDVKRLWLISSSWKRDGILDQHAQAVRELLGVHYTVLDKKEFDGVLIELYQRK